MQRDIPIYTPSLPKIALATIAKEYLKKQLSGNTVTVKRTEDKICQQLGFSNFTLVANGTVAISAALRALQLEPKSRILIPDFAYVAVAHCVIDCGFIPVPVDVDRQTWQMSYEDFQAKLEGASAVILVNNYGYVENHDRFIKKCNDLGIYTIEDCAESFGSSNINSELDPDFRTFSFFANKIITCGEGGGLVAKSEIHLKNIRSIRSQGILDREKLIHDSVGLNFRLNSISAAILASQLRILSRNRKRKLLIHKNYQNGLAGIPGVKFQTPSPGSESEPP